MKQTNQGGKAGAVWLVPGLSRQLRAQTANNNLWLSCLFLLWREGFWCPNHANRAWKCLLGALVGDLVSGSFQAARFCQRALCGFTPSFHECCRGNHHTTPWHCVMRTEIPTSKIAQTSELSLRNMFKIRGKKKTAHWQRPSDSKLNFQVRFLPLPSRGPWICVETQLSSWASCFQETTREY